MRGLNYPHEFSAAGKSPQWLFYCNAYAPGNFTVYDHTLSRFSMLKRSLLV